MTQGSDRANLIPCIIFICLLFALTSCRSQNRIYGYIHQRLHNNPTTLDPAFIVDVTGGMIAAKLFNGLVRLDEQLNIISDIAERWDISPDGKVYLFHLRKNVLFHNKREVTASDFKFSFERILDPELKSPNSWVLSKISGAAEYEKGMAVEVSGITVVGSHTLQIRLESPFSPFMHLLTMTPAYVLPKEEVEKWGRDFSTHPSGTGPYLLGDWRHNVSVRLEKNKGYFEGPPHVNGILYRIIPEDLTAVAEFEIGNLDVISIPVSEYQRYSKSEKWSRFISSMKGINTYYLGLNCSRAPFSDINARKGIAMAIDRKKILETFYENRGRLADGPVPDLLRRWSRPQHAPYDPEKAEKLIKQSGLAGRSVDFYVTADPEMLDIAEIIQSYLAKAGVSVRIRQLEWSAYKAAVNNGEADMFWLSWWADYPDPENFLFPLFHSSNHGAGGNRTRYTNRTVDAFIEAGQKSPLRKEMLSSYAEAEKIIALEAPWVFFWHKTDFAVRQPWLKNYKIYPIYSIDKGMEISL